jgi:hypothetical protein
VKRAARLVVLVLVATLVAATTAWGVLAIHFAAAAPPALRDACAAAFGVLGLGALVSLALHRGRWALRTAFVLGFTALLAWWQGIEPSNDRHWQPEVAVLPSATFDGELVTVHNIRNFDYRTETDFTPAYYDRTFDLRELESVDLIAVYWMGPDIAHTMLSFGFRNGDHLAVSIETRKEVGEGYSTIKGFFRQFELYYVVADERDVVRLRTNYRKDPIEDVYVYRLKRPLENGRRLFREYMRRINALNERAEFYNTLLTNCTTTIWQNTRVNPGRLKFSWKLLASGHVPEYLYEIGALDTSLPFEELQRRSLVNARGLAAGQAADFSARIREGLPGAKQ